MPTNIMVDTPESRIKQEQDSDFDSNLSQSGDSNDGEEIHGFMSEESSNSGDSALTTSQSDDRTNGSTSARPTPHGFVESPPASRSNSGIKDDLWLLHADEMISLSQRKRPVVHSSDTYVTLFGKIVGHYLHFLQITWVRCGWSILVLPGTTLDRLSMIAFASMSSWILFGLMIWCLFINHPYLVIRFNQWSNKNAKGLSMANASYPAIFHKTTAQDPGVQAARVALANSMPPRNELHDQEAPRTFNLDIAKLLFQCAALMYERTSNPLLDVLETTRDKLNVDGITASSDIAQPRQVLKDGVGSQTVTLISECLHKHNEEENEMTRFAAKLGMKYATISELNSQTSACSGLFWDPASTFIILAFKGTSPEEFVEWAGDFTYEPRDAGDWIRGFGKVHGGFMERVFPRKLAPGARVPYYTIRDAVRNTASHLCEKRPPGTKINVWFTGHSLGTAIASLVYARAVNEPRDFGPNVVIRDAFMYAAPILCDVQSAQAFHNRMYHDERRTLWRITNSYDCVATSLPDWGDDLRIHLSPYNLFSFSHLGMEITMHPAPMNKVLLSGNAMPYGSPVFIEGTSVEKGGEEDEVIQEARLKIARLVSYPLVGRILCHGTAAYWDQLQRVQTGRCEWKDI
ncbi:hypothetical protein M408DRAFT_323826 [Serendipita vermifera MAFF 305830]|uniref:Fungal lipase-type domain-containing protein n=1 Tax=Serendipita vermifera MAFF 305830 TaxID=933852 RepID=A0A0C2WYE5_SERVB|nr:hypothetical protein M408DRAFT_323826 [Serendipita vermifera MAFF 305830]